MRDLREAFSYAHERGFDVVFYGGGEMVKCIEDAVTTACLTGSIGATVDIAEDGIVHSSATVERIA